MINSDSNTLKSAMDKLKASRQKLGKLDSNTRKALNIQGSRVKRITSSILKKTIPDRLKPKLPLALNRWVAQESDILEMLENKMRTNTTDIQECLISLATIADKKRSEQQKLREDIARAREEEWSVQMLYDYMAERADINICNEVKSWLDTEFGLMSVEEKENCRQEILQHLESSIENGEVVLEIMSKAGRTGLYIFRESISQLFSYVLVSKPISIIRDSAKALGDTNMSIFMGKEALLGTLKSSLETLDAAIDASRVLQQYTLSSPAVLSELQSNSRKIEEKLASTRSRMLNAKSVPALSA